MDRTVCIIQGHPHGGGKHLCHAIADAYADGAKVAGARVRRIDLGDMDIDMLRNPAEFGAPPSTEIQSAQKAILASSHLVVIYPLWLGTMPAVVKAFFEQLSRNNFAITNDPKNPWPRQMLKGKSARVIVTMGMPATAYKLMFGADGVRGFESGILGMAGIKPIRETLIGGVGALTRTRAEALLARIRRLGQSLN
jgi:putative NADPH-quinone reductase